jgi:hypothetical protein
VIMVAWNAPGKREAPPSMSWRGLTWPLAPARRLLGFLVRSSQPLRWTAQLQSRFPKDSSARVSPAYPRFSLGIPRVSPGISEVSPGYPKSPPDGQYLSPEFPPGEPLPSPEFPPDPAFALAVKKFLLRWPGQRKTFRSLI